MKIFCIGKNYAKHAQEMNSAVPDQPVIFMKPQTSLVRDNHEVYYPDFTNSLHFECELVVKIAKNGKSISPSFAMDYVSEVTVGIDFTARDLQLELKNNGYPWEISKAFDHSAPIGSFIPATDISDWNAIEIALDVNGERKQTGNTKDLVFDIPTLIAHVSKYFTLQTGDLLFTGTPEGVGPVAIGDQLQASLNGQSLLDFHVR